jgi:response regulator RpfG family c-di-GMP phosphodiesterase
VLPGNPAHATRADEHRQCVQYIHELACTCRANERGGRGRVFYHVPSARKDLLLLDPDLCRRLRLGTAILRRRWRLRTARSGEEGLALLSAYPALVILVDCEVLRMNAYDLVPRMQERAPEAVIVGLAQHAHEGEASGIDVVLSQPPSLELLFETMDDIYTRAEQRVADADAVPPGTLHSA